MAGGEEGREEVSIYCLSDIIYFWYRYHYLVLVLRTDGTNRIVGEYSLYAPPIECNVYYYGTVHTVSVDDTVIKRDFPPTKTTVHVHVRNFEICCDHVFNDLYDQHISSSHKQRRTD